MIQNYLALLTLVLIYFVFNIYVRYRIKKYPYASEKRRAKHNVIIWILPFIGPFLIKIFWQKKVDKEIEVMTKSKRKTSKSNFYESGKGIFG
jgi:heme/copper-type cytochrome/quinol oxidase subunit 2